MATKRFSDLTNMGATVPAADDGLAWQDKSDTTESATGTSKRWEWLDFLRELFATRFGADAGSTDTYVVTLSPVPLAYVTGEHYRFKANTANTGACTVNFNGLGAKTIKKAAGGITTDLADNDIRAGQWVDLVYDGTNMQMQSQLGNTPSGGSGGVGDVVGPGSSTDNALVRFDSTTGKLTQNSTVTLDDTGAITVPEMAAPSTPGANKVTLYAKSDGLLYSKDDAGSETLVSGGAGGGSIAPLVVEDANTVAQRNSTNNQNFSVYRNYVSSGNYQRIRVGWTGTAAEIMSEGATQGASNILIKVGNGTSLNMGDVSLVPSADNTFALGSSGGYFAEIYNRDWITRSGGMLRFVSGARLKGPATGILNFTDDTGNSGSGTFRFDNRTPSTITSDQNNYSVPVTGYFIRLATDASRTLTGLTFGGGGVGDGQVHLLVNVGSSDLVLAHESASSTAGNRFTSSTGANITLSAKQAADIIYDGTTSRWLVFKRN